MSMPSYKLIYFNIKGRGEVARLIFAQAGVQYEDKRVAFEEWMQLKPNTPTGMLPVLDVDGKQLSGSGTINRFLAERFGLAGNNDIENAEIAGIIDVFTDLFLRVSIWSAEKDEARKEMLKKNIEDNEIPKYIDILEKICSANEGKFIYGDKVTYADLSIFGGLDLVGKAFPTVLEGRPGLSKLKEAVENLPNIARWLKDRPETQ